MDEWLDGGTGREVKAFRTPQWRWGVRLYELGRITGLGFSNNSLDAAVAQALTPTGQTQAAGARLGLDPWRV